MKGKITITCKTCGESWKPFTGTITTFFEDHKKRHNLPEEPPYTPLVLNYDYQQFLKERLEWKHKYFEDSRPDSSFGLISGEVHQ